MAVITKKNVNDNSVRCALARCEGYHFRDHHRGKVVYLCCTVNDKVLGVVDAKNNIVNDGRNYGMAQETQHDHTA